jgi:hypothetical protein
MRRGAGRPGHLLGGRKAVPARREDLPQEGAVPGLPVPGWLGRIPLGAPLRACRLRPQPVAQAARRL